MTPQFHKGTQPGYGREDPERSPPTMTMHGQVVEASLASDLSQTTGTKPGTPKSPPGRTLATSLRRTLATSLIGLAFISLSCGGNNKATTLPQPDVDLGLGDVVMMTWTTRSVEGLLGHVVPPSGETELDPHRRPVDGEVTFVSTDQNLEIVVSIKKTATLGGGYGLVTAEVGASGLTHVAYDVHITGYADILPRTQKYLSESGCCLGGTVAPSCGEFFVSRAIRGSGKIQYLAQVDGTASVQAANLIRAEGGASFRRLSKSSFEDTFFAYELAPLESICARLTPEEEMPAIQVAAPNNCFTSIFQANGERETKSYHLPSSALCQKVAQAACEKVPDAIACQARYGRGENVTRLDLRLQNAATATALAEQTSVTSPENKTSDSSPQATAPRAPSSTTPSE